MRDYGRVSTTIWHSRKFRSLKSADAQLLYLYLLTCPHVNSSGCFVLRDGYATDDLDWEPERYRTAIKALSKALLIGFDEGEKLVRIVGFFRFEPITNINHAKGTAKAVIQLPDCDVKLLTLKELFRQPYAEKLPEIDRAIKGLSEPYRTPEPETEPEPTTEPTPETEPDFIPPSESETSDSIPLFGDDQKKPPPKQKRASQLPEGWVPNEKNVADAHKLEFTDWEIENEGNQFRDYHHAKGSKFIDWNASWRTWLRNAIKFGRRRGAQNGGGMGFDAKAAEIADRATRYAQDRVAKREAGRDARSGLGQD